MAASQFFFNILCLGDHQSIANYIEEENIPLTNQDADIMQWHIPFHYGENKCEIDITLPVLTADYDDLIGMTDGILYFLNPNSQVEIDLLQEVIKIINNFRRDISIVIIFRDKNGLIQQSSNEILEWIWTQYLYEGYIADFGSHNQIREILNEFTYCIMTGQPLINYNTAWLEIPVLIKNINQEIDKKNWLKAGKLAQKMHLISTRFGLMDQHIIAEQCASLYLNANDYIAAADIIKIFNPLEQEFRRKYYIQNLEGGIILTDKKKFSKAAQKYEFAANFAGLELKEPELKKNALKLAIFNWISACEVQNAYRLLDQFDNTEIKVVLESLTEKIANSADYLISINQEELAKTILYLSIDRFQREGLFDALKVLSAKVIKVLMIILDKQLRENQMSEGKLTLDELYNIWESYNVKQENIDPYLQKLIRLYIKARDFSKVDLLIPKIQALDVKQAMTKELAEEMELKQTQQKQADTDDIIKGLEVLLDYVKEEAMQFYDINRNIYEQAEKYVKINNFQKAAQIIVQQADWLRNIGQEMLYFDVIEHACDIYFQGQDLSNLLKYIIILPDENRKRYLSRKTQDLVNIIIQDQEKRPFEELENLTTNFIKIYRNLLLYEDSKKIAHVLVAYLIKTGQNIDLSKNEQSISRCIELMQKSEQVCQAYFEKKEPELDSLLSKIVEYYIYQRNITAARQFNERINNRQIALNYNNQIEDIEHSNMGKISQKAMNEQSKKIGAEQISQLQNISRDQRLIRDNMLRMRNGLKKHYFQKPIDAIIKQDFISAADSYIEIALELIRSKKYELASISAAVGELIYIYLQRISLLNEKVKQIDGELGLSSQIYHDTFPIKWIDYIIQMNDANLSSKVQEALQLHEVLALFPEEILIIEAIMKSKPSISDALKNLGETLDINEKEVPSNYKTLIQKLNYDPALNTKRNSFESKYWASTNDEIAAQNYEAASSIYLSSVDEFLNRNNDNLAKISVIMAMMSLLKVKSASTVQTELEKVIFKEMKRCPGFKNSVEFNLFEIFLEFYDKSDKLQEIREIGQAFYDKLPLLDWEKSFILSFIKTQEKVDEHEQGTVGISISTTDQMEDDTLIFQQMVVLSQQLNELKPQFEELLKKRELGKRTYYEEIFTDLNNRQFLDAADKYIKLAKRMARRDDFELAAIMIFLSTLCNIKAGIKFIEIKNKIDQELTSLGLVKKILDDTFGVKIAFFILDALKIDDPSIQINLKSIFQALPILTEELDLTQF